MPKRVFRVAGSFRATHHDQPFSKEVVAETAEAAREYVYSLFGSKHGVPRRLVTITKAEEVPAGRVEDPVVRFAAGLGG